MCVVQLGCSGCMRHMVQLCDCSSGCVLAQLGCSRYNGYRCSWVFGRALLQLRCMTGAAAQLQLV